jgi:peroxiredoxin Q/BCP
VDVHFNFYHANSSFRYGTREVKLMQASKGVLKQVHRVKVGDIAPDFSLPNQFGSMVSLKDFIGKKIVVLYFYPRDFSPGCTAEACAFRDSYEVFKESGAEVIGVSSQSVDSHNKFASMNRLPFILLSDEGGKVTKLYGVQSTFGIFSGRVTYIIDKKGVVRHMFSSQFNPTKHIKEALLKLKEIDKD